MPLTINAVCEPYNQSNRTHQYGIENQPVHRRNDNQIGYRQFPHSFQDADIGKSRHPFVRDDACVIRHANQVDCKRKDRKLKHPIGCRHPYVRDVHLHIQEPYAYRFGKQDYQYSQPYLYGYGGRKYLLQVLPVSCPQLVSDKSSNSRRKRTGKHGEHRHHSAHHIVDTEIFHSQGVQHHT